MEGASIVDEPLKAGGSARATILLSSGLVANLATQMTFATTLHEIATAWSLDASESGWIGGIYFAGYAIAVPLLSSATDGMCWAQLTGQSTPSEETAGYGFDDRL